MQEIDECMGYSKRTIERERVLGLTEQLKSTSKGIKTCGISPNNGSTLRMWCKGDCIRYQSLAERYDN